MFQNQSHFQKVQLPSPRYYSANNIAINNPHSRTLTLPKLPALGGPGICRLQLLQRVYCWLELSSVCLLRPFKCHLGKKICEATTTKCYILRALTDQPGTQTCQRRQ